MLLSNNNFKNRNLVKNDTPSDKTIGKNTITANQFINRKKQSMPDKDQNIFTKDISAFKYTDPIKTEDMYDKSLAMLHERYKKNLITLDEFNKKCEQLGKVRKQ